MSQLDDHERRITALERANAGHSAELARLITGQDAIYGKLDELSTRLDGVSTRLNTMKTDMDERFETIGALLEAIIARLP